MTSSEPSKEEILDRLAALEEENQQLREQVEELEELREENKRLRAKLWWYEGPHTPPSKEQSDEEESSSSDGDEDDEQPRTDGGTPGRKTGHEPEWRDAPDPDQEIEVTCDCCPECGEQFDESAGVSPDSSRNSLTHSHQKSHSTIVTTTSATLVGQTLLLHTPTAPVRGSSG